MLLSVRLLAATSVRGLPSAMKPSRRSTLFMRPSVQRLQQPALEVVDVEAEVLVGRDDRRSSPDRAGSPRSPGRRTRRPRSRQRASRARASPCARSPQPARADRQRPSRRSQARARTSRQPTSLKLLCAPSLSWSAIDEQALGKGAAHRGRGEREALVLADGIDLAARADLEAAEQLALEVVDAKSVPRRRRRRSGTTCRPRPARARGP